MTGTNPIATWLKNNFLTQGPTAYKTALDGNAVVAERIVDNFAAHESSPAAMTVRLDAGHIFNGTTLTEVAAQTTGAITAPVGNPRIDRVVIDNLTGAVSVITGTPAGSPSAPAITAGKSPVARVLLQTSSTTITNAMITDERSLGQLGSNGVYAPLASPALTGTPTAPTPANGDADTSIATSAFVQNAIGPAAMPGGRLTLTSATPVMTSDAAAATSVYYTPHLHTAIPIYDGTNFNLKTFAELTLALDNDSGHPGYHQSGKNFDLFVVNDSGTIRLGTGPAWSTDTARGTGAGTTELQRVNGIWTNKVSMTLRFGSVSGNTITVEANEGTYVGTMRATANGQTAMVFKPSATAGGNANVLGLWNAYNRVLTRAVSRNSQASWTYAAATWQPANAGGTGSGLNNRISFIDGLQQSAVKGIHMATNSNSGGQAGGIGINLDSTSATPSDAAQNGNSGGVTLTAEDAFVPQIGFHYVQAMEYSTGATSTFFGVANSQQVQALIAELEM